VQRIKSPPPQRVEHAPTVFPRHRSTSELRAEVLPEDIADATQLVRKLAFAPGFTTAQAEATRLFGRGYRRCVVEGTAGFRELAEKEFWG
jgi:hypothetical protein